MRQDYLDSYAEENGFTGAFRTSAKTGHNVTQVFAHLVRNILKADLSNQQKEEEDLPYHMKGGVKPSFKLN
eukprot:CAMPEP_0205815490 /NCGR_PEP_ID=MMETSP0205-20121125/21305_1 /ASSEMBLY_ACC=CAM_ASM_000278 /TAXON_ID=36767 /ORGANISM="Euplotes focardii, Strain TN1" /LENGTH=70 /DNA_ID=CAMNT_0053101943 /DNA_START=18 /DNA_END=227 /DNA_ORIENTATION=+